MANSKPLKSRPSGHVEMFAPEQPRYWPVVHLERSRAMANRQRPAPRERNANRSWRPFPPYSKGRGCVGCAMACSDEFVSSKFDSRLSAAVSRSYFRLWITKADHVADRTEVYA